MLEEITKPRIGAARNLARALLKKSGVIQPPVSLGIIISFLKQNHDVTVYKNINFSDKLSGMLVTIESDCLDDRRDEIHVNQNHSWGKRRFTIAHEIGHMLMNTTCNNLDTSLNDNSPAEIEANQFAAELLMPLEMLKKDFISGVDIKSLAWKYIVSQEAMGWKIAGSGLLTKF